MSTEYDLYNHPQLNPIIQQKVATTILRVSRICWKMCYKDAPIDENCIQNCTENYIRTYDIILEELKNLPKKQT